MSKKHSALKNYSALINSPKMAVEYANSCGPSNLCSRELSSKVTEKV